VHERIAAIQADGSVVFSRSSAETQRFLFGFRVP
jgi:hypothetical protein